MSDSPMDVNDQVEAEWVDETTPYERVRSVMKRTYDGHSAAEIAERARTTPKTARKHLDNLAEEGFVKRTKEPARSATLYRRSDSSLVIEQATQILSESDPETLTTRIAEMQTTLREYRNEYAADSPEDAVLQERDIDTEVLQEWQRTRRNVGFAKVALALREAEHTVNATQAAR